MYCPLFLQQKVKKMNNNIKLLKKSIIFNGLTNAELDKLLSDISSKPRTIPKGTAILTEGEITNKAYLIVSGEVIISRTDYWGNQSIIAKLTAPDIFGETFAFIEDMPVTVDVTASSQCTLISLERDKILSNVSDSAVKEKLLKNLIYLFAQKNYYLSGKITVLSQRGIRKKLLSYLSQKASENGSSSFDINFNRQQLADYLSVDRSALSSEISKLKEEGLIENHKKHFSLLEP